VHVYVVRLQHPPIITDRPHNQTVLVGDTVHFKCGILSDAPYHLKWLKHLDDNETSLIVLDVSALVTHM